MFIHIGKNRLVSDRNCVGIFNVDTLKMSDDNIWLMVDLKDDDKMISLDTDNNIIASEVSSFTVIQRAMIKEHELFWSKKK